MAGEAAPRGFFRGLRGPEHPGNVLGDFMVMICYDNCWIINDMSMGSPTWRSSMATNLYSDHVLSRMILKLGSGFGMPQGPRGYLAFCGGRSWHQLWVPLSAHLSQQCRQQLLIPRSHGQPWALWVSQSMCKHWRAEIAGLQQRLVLSNSQLVHHSSRTWVENMWKTHWNKLKHLETWSPPETLSKVAKLWFSDCLPSNFSANPLFI